MNLELKPFSMNVIVHDGAKRIVETREVLAYDIQHAKIKLEDAYAREGFPAFQVVYNG